MRQNAVGADERRPRDAASPAGRGRRAGRSGAGRGRRRASASQVAMVFERVARPARRPASAGAVAAPGPRCRCMSTTSSQRSNFQPAASIVPAWREAERAVHADRAGVGRIADHGEHLARAGGLAARQQLGQQQPADSRGRPRRRRGRSSPRGRSGRPAAAGTGWRRRSRAPSPSLLGDELGQALGEDVVAAARHLGRSGGSISKVPVPCSTCRA